ncbi:hypothetical protein SAMN02910276_01717 [Butyrivibrio sp. Su6]|uniref:hypothetical protein n=1 Tax=Butyrivibrio sp. Su6 TaxID=1520810 RepID=UPI00089ED033|nr:hypothetical protein [Butyrivibrio sp. Su6]SEG04003.1 hypothetical protein SAMN02910276_01717 [Butyrivibrio sp. Su6]
MNFRGKWDKQNNSVKLLLKKLKRHDTLVVAVAVIIALVLCGGLIYISTPVAMATAKEEFAESEKESKEATNEKLDELHEYLTELDKSIVDSKNGLDSFYELTKEDKTNEHITEKVTTLGGNLKELHSEVIQTDSQIQNMKELIEKNGGENKEKLNQEFSQVSERFNQIENNYSKAQTDNKELMDSIKNLIKSNDTKMTGENLKQYTDLVTKLSDLDKNFTTDMGKSVDLLEKNIKELNEATEKRLAELDKTTSSKLDEMNTSTKNKLDEMNTSTKNKLDEIDTTTKNKLDEMNNSTNNKLSEMDASTNRKLDEMNTSTNNKLDEMNASTNSRLDEMGNSTNSKLDDLDKRTGSKLDELGKNTNNKLDEINKATNDRLNSMDKSTSDKLDSMDKSTNSKIDAMGKSTNSKLDAMDKATSSKLDGMNKTNTNKFNELNTSINNNFKNITNTSLNNTNGLKSYITTELNKTNGKIDKVFQRVSDGKKLLASTLLTKGVKVRQDATFKELSDAINKIPQQVVLGNGDVAGKVEYEYHYHKDGAGRVCDEEYVPANRKGGCYNVSVTHKHTDSCYKIEYWYSYRTRKDCDNLYHVTDRDNGDDPIFRWRCNYCGSEYDSDDGYHSESTTDINVFRDRGKSDPEVHMNKIKICKYEDGQLLGYRPSCGYVHGQILKAHISFNQNYKDYNSTVNVPSPRNVMTSHMMVSDKTMDLESLFKGFEFSDDGSAVFKVPIDESTEGMSDAKEMSPIESLDEKKSEEAAHEQSTMDNSGKNLSIQENNSSNQNDSSAPESIAQESSLIESSFDNYEISENNTQYDDGVKEEKEEANDAASTDCASDQTTDNE